MTAKIHGRLGSLDCALTTAQSVYAVPASRKATVNVRVCNRNSTSATIRLMHCNGAIGTLADDDYLEYGYVLGANEVLERTGITMTTTHCIGFYSSTTGVTVTVDGVEEDV